METKVVITTSGIGSRLKELTTYTNKSLVRLGKKPTLSYIIESYQTNVPIVITVRYKAEQVMEFVKLVYPDRPIEFSIEPQKAPMGSVFSLGLSLLTARSLLPGPFIFQCGDTVVQEEIPPVVENWNGGFRGTDSAHYSTFKVKNGYIEQIMPKRALDFDQYHIGLVACADVDSFWSHLDRLQKTNPLDESLNDVAAINSMIKDGIKFRSKEFATWLDMGNLSSLAIARKSILDASPENDQLGENIFDFGSYLLAFGTKEHWKNGEVPESITYKGNKYSFRSKGEYFNRYE